MIHVIGNAAVDTVIRLERFPLPGETIIADSLAEDLGGKGANQAIVIARCGVPARLIAAIGNDAPGQRIRENLAAEGVMTDGLWISDAPTDRCSIYVDRGGENTIVSLVEAARHFDPLLSLPVATWIGPHDYAVFQGNLQSGVLNRCLDLARRQSAVTVLNPSPISDPTRYDWRLVDIAVMNRGEAEVLGGSMVPVEAAERLLDAGAGVVVVTLGAEGAMLVGRDCRASLDAPEVQAVDSTGAGDVFCGALVAARSKGLPWKRGLRVAIGAAAVKVTRPGVRASFPTRSELERLMLQATEQEPIEGDMSP